MKTEEVRRKGPRRKRTANKAESARKSGTAADWYSVPAMVSACSSEHSLAGHRLIKRLWRDVKQARRGMSNRRRDRILSNIEATLDEASSPTPARIQLLRSYVEILLHAPSYRAAFAGDDELRDQLIERIDRAIRAEADRLTNPYCTVFEGVIHHLRGEHQAASDLFVAAARDPMRECFSKRWSGIATASVSAAEEALSDKPTDRPLTLGEVDWRLSPTKATQVVSVSVDAVYFARFAEAMCRTVQDEGLVVHFHVVNPPSDLAARQRTLQATLERVGARLAISTEAFEVPDRAYFALVRLLRSRQWLTTFEAPVLLVDGDAGFVGRLAEHGLMSSMEQIGLLPIMRDYAPWCSVSARGVYLPANDHGSRFATLLEKVSQSLWATADGQRWWIDHNALFYTRMLGGGGDAATASLRARWPDVIGHVNQKNKRP